MSILLTFVLLFASSVVWAQDVSNPVQCPKPDGTACALRWDKNTEPDMREYRVYAAEQGTALVKANPIAVVPHDPAAAEIKKQVDGSVFQEGTTYEIAVTAVDQAGNESGFSNSVFLRWDAPPSVPGNVTIIFVP